MGVGAHGVELVDLGLVVGNKLALGFIPVAKVELETNKIGKCCISIHQCGDGFITRLACLFPNNTSILGLGVSLDIGVGFVVNE